MVIRPFLGSGGHGENSGHPPRGSFLGEPPTPGWKIPQFEKNFKLNFFGSNGDHGDDCVRCLHSTDQFGRCTVSIMRLKTAKEVYNCFNTPKFKCFPKKKAEVQEKAAMQEINFKMQTSQKEEEKIKSDNYFNTKIQSEREG